MAHYFKTLLLLPVILASTGCPDKPPPAAATSRTIYVMGTEATVTLPAGQAGRLATAADIVETVFDETQQRLSLFRDDSELSAINRQAGQTPVIVSSATFETIDRALEFARLSGGAFDPTVAPLVRLWGRGVEPRPRLPPAIDLTNALGVVGFRKVRLDRRNHSVYLEKSGMALDLGGIAKGTAADSAAAALTASGYTNYLINLGGDIRSRGAPDGHDAWRIGVRDPFDTRRLLGSVRLAGEAAIATSGNYERSIVIEGRRYGHLIDPRTGYPVRDMAGVTVLAPDAETADALSTALFVAGLEQAAAILEQAPGTAALLVPDRQPLEIWITPELAGNFEPRPEHRNAVRHLPLGKGRNERTSPLAMRRRWASRWPTAPARRSSQ